jgi:glycerol-3-phosphate dehydrogenase (NAD(P)+)
MFMVAEGVKTTRAVQAIASHRSLELPIVRAAHAILYEGTGVREALDTLMARHVGREFDAFGLMPARRGG